MPRPHALLLLPAVVLLGACAAAITPGDGGVSGDSAVSGDTLPSTDASTTEVGPQGDGGCAAPNPGLGCVSGTPGGACGDAALMMVCVGGAWRCPSGTIPTNQCACIGRPPGACACTSSGWQCQDASVPPDASGDAGCAQCLGSSLRWGWSGGFVAYTETATLAPCRTFTFARSGGGGTSPLECSNELTACDTTGPTSLATVRSWLADPDVTAALAVAPVLFGRDSRPVDGQVYQIEVGGLLLELGDACSAGDPSCRAVPAGLQRLRTNLENLQRERLRLGACVSVFPDAG